MISFLFASLFSWMFWLLYFGLSLFIGTVTIKMFAPCFYEYIYKGERRYSKVGSVLGIEAFFVVLVHFVFWPIVLFCYLIKFMFMKVFLKFGISLLKSVDSIVPDFEIKEKNNED